MFCYYCAFNRRHMFIRLCLTESTVIPTTLTTVSQTTATAPFVSSASTATTAPTTATTGTNYCHNFGTFVTSRERTGISTDISALTCCVI